MFSLLMIAKLIWVLGTASAFAPLFWIVAVVAVVMAVLGITGAVSEWQLRREHARAAR